MKTTGIVILWVVFIAAGIAVLVTLGAGLAWGACSMRYARTDLESRWVFPSGCQIKFNGKWIPEDRYRVIP